MRGAQQWIEAAQPQQEHRAMAMSVALPDGRIAVLGGRNRCDQALSSVEVLSADGKQWTTKQPMPVSRQGAAIGRLHNGKVIVAGGSGGHTQNERPDGNGTGPRSEMSNNAGEGGYEGLEFVYTRLCTR
jgi:hypothetical protein